MSHMEAKDCGCSVTVSSGMTILHSGHCRYPALLAQFEYLMGRMCKCGHTLRAHSGHATLLGHPEPDHCSQGHIDGSQCQHFEPIDAALLAENAELKTQLAYYESLYGTRLDSQQQVIAALREDIDTRCDLYSKLSQERDALAGELARYKAFVREKCGPQDAYENGQDYHLYYCGSCDCCVDEKKDFQHTADCLYIAAGGE